MTTPAIDALLLEMRSMATQMGNKATVTQSSGEEAADFASLLKQSLDTVNAVQQQTQQVQQAYEAGDPKSDLQDVMLSLQKASLSFQTMLQVRNKLVSAYQEVMNIQV